MATVHVFVIGISRLRTCACPYVRVYVYTYIHMTSMCTYDKYVHICINRMLTRTCIQPMHMCMKKNCTTFTLYTCIMFVADGNSP